MKERIRYKNLNGIICQISDSGVVINTITGKVYKPIRRKTSGNYYQYTVSVRHKHFVIARLVAELFVENDDPERKIYVDHIDTDTSNNRWDNLKWVTASENVNNPLTKRHMSEAMKGHIPWDKGVEFTDEHKTNISNALKGKYSGSKNPNSKRIKQLTKDGELIKVWDCIQSAVDELGISQPSISNVLTGRRKYAGGYGWCYF